MKASAHLMGGFACVIRTAVESTNVVLATHIRAAAEQHRVGGPDNGSLRVGGPDNGGGADSSSSSCCCDGGGVARSMLAGDGPLAGGGLDTPWRQLLLGDVRLMGLLGAAVQLWGEVEAKYVWATHVAHDAPAARWYELMREKLAVAMVLSAVAFPAEFRDAAAGGKGTAAESRAAPAAAAAAGKQGTGGRAVGGTGRSGSPLCINLAEARVVMEAAGFADGVEVVNRVLGGWEPTAAEVWGLAGSCLGRCGVAAEELPGMLAALVPPAEVRAAVAAAAAV